jgi:predicted transcriptional regulator
LSKSSKSPIELAEESSTSVSNISQSLRFLELAGIVKSERISNRDKGQPRVAYSLASDKAYIIVTSKNFVNKKLVFLDRNKQITLKIWFYDNEALQPFIEKAVQNIEDIIPSAKGIFIDNDSAELKLILVPRDKAFKKEIKEITITLEGASRKAKYSVADASSLQKDSSRYYAIYDPENMIGGSNT